MKAATKTPAQLAQELVSNPYAWPGGYPQYAITNDCGVICHRCCKAAMESIEEATPDGEWYIVALDVNWEDNTLPCDHCGKLIPAAYDE